MTIKEYVKLRKEQIKEEIKNMAFPPHLVIVQLNDDEASKAYVKGKIKDATELGIKATLLKLDVFIKQEELLKVIDNLNNDESVDGFIVQMPLPSHIDNKIIQLAISPDKDVDGFHPLSKFIPCTPLGILTYLKHEGVPLIGKNALVIGRSDIVGRPMAKLLLNESMNVTVCHSKTPRKEMESFVKNADLIVVAVGKMNLLDDTYIYKKDTIIVDVGINRDINGLHGDCAINLPVKLQTPVPGGVGLLTRITLMENLLKAVK